MHVPKNKTNNEGNKYCALKINGKSAKNSDNLSQIPSIYAPKLLVRFFERAIAPSKPSNKNENKTNTLPKSEKLLKILLCDLDGLATT
jgi:hypothetical protein